MQQEKSFSEIESLNLIESMINKARNQLSEGGHLFLLWGWIVFFCSIGQFVLMTIVHFRHHYAIWLLTWLALIYQTIYLSRKSKKKKVRTYTDEMVNYLWLSFIITMFVTGFVIGRSLGTDSYKLLNAVILSLYGIPCFLSGIIIRFRPLMIGGISCWLLSIAATFLPYEYHLLLISVAMVTAWIVPGYLLQSRFQKQITYATEKTL